MQLNTPVTELGRLTPPQVSALKRLGILTVEDLLYHFPVRYSDISTVKQIREIVAGEQATLYGKLSGLKTKKSFRGKIPMAEGVLEDVHGNTIKIVWFHQAYLAKMLKDGDAVKLTGKISEGKNGFSLTNPEVEHAPDLPIDSHDSLFAKETTSEHFGYPIYPESRGITSKWFYHAIKKIFGSKILDSLVDPIPEDILKEYHLPPLKTALVWVHTPQKAKDAESARKRFAFEEIFFIQLQKQKERKEFEENFSYKITVPEESVKKFTSRFPFTPTDAQNNALKTIFKDITSQKPMSRLLEGDVGSGKTFVAATVAYAVVTNRPKEQTFGNLQVAYMAPTEVLAGQLFENFIQYFKNTNLQIGFLTGSGCKKFPSKVDPSGATDVSRAQLLKWVKNGEIPILVGTHTLIQKSVEFKDLGLVIVDEQHRFGTNQRMKLVKKDGHVPHYLSMTATPIPRTLALTIYGDLDLTIIDQMPAGRKNVITEIVAPNKRDASYEKIREELEAGRQAYVICARINDPDPEKETALRLKSVKSEAIRLKKEVFQKFRIEIMHSKMTKTEKENVMKKFYAHEIDILVSTSVVEVGVNVPNATVIVIEGAERFGLAQLHQLRGRVLRSNHQAYCFLFADSKTTKSLDRLKALVTAKNGFELAELDLALRGTGDLLGQKQWGISDLGMEAIKNIKMVEAARTKAREIIEEDVELKKYPELKKVLERHYAKLHFE